MPSHAIARSAISAIIAGIVAAVIYEVVYFLTSNHQVQAGLTMATIIGASTLVVAFIVSLIIMQAFQKRS